MTREKGAPAPAQDGANPYEGRLKSGVFAPGNRASVGHGRPKGMLAAKKVRAVFGRELLEALARGDETLPSAYERWTTLLKSRDERIRLEAEKFLHEVTNGRPAQTLQLAPPGGGSGELILRWQEARAGGDAATPALPATLIEARALLPPTSALIHPQEVDAGKVLSELALSERESAACPERAPEPSGAPIAPDAVETGPDLDRGVEPEDAKAPGVVEPGGGVS